MRRSMGLIALALAAVIAAVPAQAQDRKEVQGYVAAGYVMPEGIAGDYLNGGWNLSGGAIFRPAPAVSFGIRTDFGYSYMGANSQAISTAAANGLRVDDGYMSMWNLTADFIWEFGSPDGVGGYIGAGVGGYRRYLSLTNEVLVPGYICDPWWGWCYPAAVPGDIIAADDTLTKFGYNATAGITFPVGNGQMYVEARYHWMDSEKTTQYFPILLGYRF